MSSRGLSLKTRRSASFPGSMVPSLTFAPPLAAADAVAVVSASIGARPARTRSSNSRWTARPWKTAGIPALFPGPVARRPDAPARRGPPCRPTAAGQHLVEQAERRRPEHPWARAAAKTFSSACFLDHRDVGEYRSPQGVRPIDEGLQRVLPETRAVTGDAAVDHLDEIHVVLLDESAQLPAAVHGIAHLDGEVSYPGRPRRAGSSRRDDRPVP